MVSDLKNAMIFDDIGTADRAAAKLKRGRVVTLAHALDVELEKARELALWQ